MFEIFYKNYLIQFQHTAARRRLATQRPDLDPGSSVSTHSRPKAAGIVHLYRQCPTDSFNTQPPEGGWTNGQAQASSSSAFQHTAARRRLVKPLSDGLKFVMFQHTAARRRLDGQHQKRHIHHCFNTQPPEGGWVQIFAVRPCRCHVSTHSRPKAAGTLNLKSAVRSTSFNTQPPEGGWLSEQDIKFRVLEFQHTAARRRLVLLL